MSCDHPTCFDSSSCSRKLPAVWKNFFGTIGARSVVSTNGTRSPVSSAPPRSKYSRIEGTSSTAISSPSSTPTRPSPSPNVTSFTQRLPDSSLDDLPERVLADDLVAAERPQVAAADLEAVAVDRSARQRPLRYPLITRDEIARSFVVHVGDRL